MFDPTDPARQVAETATAATKFFDLLDADVAKHGDSLLEEVKSRCKDLPPGGIAFVMDAGRKEVKEKTALYRKAKIESSQALIDEMTEKIEKNSKVVDQLAPINRSPRSILEAVASSDARFQATLGELQGAGPGTLQTRLAVAKLQNDTVTIGAIARIVDALPKNARPFDSTQLGEELFGTLHADRAKLIKHTQIQVEALRLRRQAALTGHKIPPESRIKLGLDQRDAGVPPKPQREPPAVQVPESVAKIARGLRSDEE